MLRLSRTTNSGGASAPALRHCKQVGLHPLPWSLGNETPELAFRAAERGSRCVAHISSMQST